MNLLHLRRWFPLSALVLCFAIHGNAQEPASTPPPCVTKSGKPCGEEPDKGIRNAEREFLNIGKAPDPDAVKRGQAVYVSTCGFCHGSTARGGATGPSLVRSVLVLHDQGTGKEIGPVIHAGRPAKGMPAFDLPDSQVQDIAAFLLSLIQLNANRNDYAYLNIVTGNADKGKAYFKDHCASCHSPKGDLAHIASRFDPVALQARFLYPKTAWYPGMPPPDPREVAVATVKLASGKSYSGRLDQIDDFHIAIVDLTGERHSWTLDEGSGIRVMIEDPLKAHRDMLSQYTDADMHNILAYLETLK
jgi:cytochrome c oxidase cbb3-type subunit III